MDKRLLISANSTGLSEAMDGKGGLWFKVSAYGDFPNKAYDPRTGRQVETVQRFDRKAAEGMKEAFTAVLNKARHLFRGLPIYEGHLDDPQLLGKPGHTMPAVGRVKELDVRDDGLWARAVMNERGVPLIQGEAAPYSATSPFWWTVDTGKTEGGARVNQGTQTGDPAEAAETTETTQSMKDKIREKLGLPEDASEDEVLAAIARLMDENAALKREKGEVKTKLEEANSAREQAVAELQSYRTSEAETALNQAVEAGKITEAQRPEWAAALNSDFGAAKVLLDGLKPQSELNTSDQVGNLDKGEGVRKVASLNAKMKAYAEANNLDLDRPEHYDRAFDAVRAGAGSGGE